MKSPMSSCPRNIGGIEYGSGAAPKVMRSACSAIIASPKVSSSERIGSER